MHADLKDNISLSLAPLEIIDLRNTVLFIFSARHPQCLEFKATSHCGAHTLENFENVTKPNIFVHPERIQCKTTSIHTITNKSILDNFNRLDVEIEFMCIR